MNSHQNLQQLIVDRSQELGLDWLTLGLRLGYTNPSKAAGRVQALCDGHLTNRKSKAAIGRLGSALEVPEGVVDEALAETERQLAEAEEEARAERDRTREAADAKWRAEFRPHAVVDTESHIPSQITMCGITGGPSRWLMIPLDASKGTVTFVDQVMKRLPAMLMTSEQGIKHIPFFGRAKGFVINYSPDRAVRFDLDGKPLEVLATAVRLGNVELR